MVTCWKTRRKSERLFISKSSSRILILNNISLWSYLSK